MASGFLNSMAPASMWSYSCESCLAVHGSAMGDGPCPHQQPVFNIPPQNSYSNASNMQTTGDGVAAGFGAGTGADWLRYVGGSFGQPQESRDYNYMPNIVYDLSPADESFRLQDQPQSISSYSSNNNNNNNNDHFTPGGSNITTPGRNNYSNEHHDPGYPNGVSNDSPYHSAQASWSAGSPSGRTAPQTRPLVTEDYYYSEDDRVITDQPTNRSNRQPFINKHLRKVRKVIKDADVKLGNRQYYSS